MACVYRNCEGTRVGLWLIDLTRNQEVERSMRGLLTAAELARERRILAKDAKRNFLITRGTLRLLLGLLLGESPTDLRIRAGDRGKPILRRDGKPRLFFNVSHSHDLGMICVTDCGEVGVDLERLRPFPAAGDLARRHFTSAERDFVERASPHQRDFRFLLCWTRKEALLKATGTGLIDDLDSFEVPLSEAGLVSENFSRASRRWLVLNLPVDRDYAAAMAISGSSPKLTDIRELTVPGSPRQAPTHYRAIKVTPLISRAINSSMV